MLHGDTWMMFPNVAIIAEVILSCKSIDAYCQYY